MIFFPVCADGQYIFNRECVNCSSYCKDISRCNKLTGRCENGCIYHRTGDFCQGIFSIDKIIRYWRSFSKESKKICQKYVEILIQVNKIVSVCSLNTKLPNVLPHMLVFVYFMGFIVLHVILTITTCVCNWAILFWYICKYIYIYIYPVCPILELSSHISSRLHTYLWISSSTKSRQGLFPNACVQ